MPFLDASALNDNHESLVFLRSVLGRPRATAAQKHRWAGLMAAKSQQTDPARISRPPLLPERPSACMPLVIGVAVPVSVAETIRKVVRSIRMETQDDEVVTARTSVVSFRRSRR
jgi:hypothetical protein